MRNHTLAKIISVLTFLALLSVTAAIVTEVLLGYSGFREINNGQKKAILLEDGCK